MIQGFLPKGLWQLKVLECQTVNHNIGLSEAQLQLVKLCYPVLLKQEGLDFAVELAKPFVQVEELVYLAGALVVVMANGILCEDLVYLWIENHPVEFGETIQKQVATEGVEQVGLEVEQRQKWWVEAGLPKVKAWGWVQHITSAVSQKILVTWGVYLVKSLVRKTGLND